MREPPSPRVTPMDSPATTTALSMIMFARLKIAPAPNATSHWLLPECIRSSVNEKPSKPRLPAVSE